MITHYDLFAGIGGFSLALEEVFDEPIRHVFCEWESFPTAVLKQHWPDGEYWGDIWELILWLEQMQSDKQTGENETPTKSGNIGETTIIGTATDLELKQEIGRKLDELKSVSGSLTTTDGSVVAAENRSQSSSTSTTSTTMGVLNERRMALLERMVESSKQDSQLLTKLSAITATLQKEYTGNAHIKTNTDTPGERLERGAGQELQKSSKGFTGRDYDTNTTIVTGGFPCQPFSAAGRRRGTADPRYLWPEMFRVIQLTNPQWVIAENVRGLTNWSDGMVLEQVCTDLEAEGYEVQPFIIPAVAVNAPHRRDRVWIIAHRNNTGGGAQGHGDNANGTQSDQRRQGQPQYRSDGQSGDATDTRCKHGVEGCGSNIQSTKQKSSRPEREYPSWQRNWQEVAFATCDDSMDDGLPRLVDGVSYSRAKWRRDSFKAYGNGIVPQVAIEIMKAIKEAQCLNTCA